MSRMRRGVSIDGLLDRMFGCRSMLIASCRLIEAFCIAIVFVKACSALAIGGPKKADSWVGEVSWLEKLSLFCDAHGRPRFVAFAKWDLAMPEERDVGGRFGMRISLAGSVRSSLNPRTESEACYGRGEALLYVDLRVLCFISGGDGLVLTDNLDMLGDYRRRGGGSAL